MRNDDDQATDKVPGWVLGLVAGLAYLAMVLLVILTEWDCWWRVR